MKTKDTLTKCRPLPRFLIVLVSIFFWLVLWEISSRLVGIEFIFPGAIRTLKTLFSLIVKPHFITTVALSILRILLGLLLGILFGAFLAIVCIIVPPINTFVSIGMTVVRSTPVASIVMILWIVIGSTNLPVMIALLMVSPIIWQNLIDGYKNIDKSLYEVTEVFGFSRKKRFRLLILPTVKHYFIPAALTSVGLAWKSGVAAEIIAYTKNSIGQSIYDAKTFFEGDVMFAWTLAVILISILFESAVKAISRRLM